MNPSDRRNLIFFKANANQQRRNREVLLESLTPSLAEVLHNAQCIYTPKAHLIIKSFSSIIASSGIESGSQLHPVNYYFTEIACPEKALTLVQQVGDIDFNTYCYLSIGSVSSIYYENQCYCIPEYPVFIVKADWVHSIISDLWSIANNRLAVVGCKLEFGMIVDSYSGFLESDHNPNEIIYEVARWSNAV